MALRVQSTVGLRLLQEVCHGFLAPIAVSANTQIVRHRRTKHWDPKWKFFRRLKVMPVKLPNFQEKAEDITDEEMREKLKERGMLPTRPWMERQFFLHSTGGVFEPYVPPEGDGKVSPISKQGAMQSLRFLEKKSKTMLAIRKVKQYEEDFETVKFCKEVTDIYTKMHQYMNETDKEKLIDFVTERAYPEVIHNIKNKTIRWKFIKEIELPRIVHARCTDVVTKDNIFAQLTVRFHTQQILAIYDRFGRLMHGSEILAKDVLEYVVFEKNISNQYGTWRVHAKIIPDWLPPKEPSKITYKRKPEPVKLIEDTTAKVPAPSEEKNVNEEKLNVA
ncbi:unnamed protein product [Phyllotreta striolata]|uniref:Large ribosomal subunit protein mL45 n=1 Tax=Phyllotreta striolata TaxID=444603 RepID=A0A9N9TUF9_PHYSR|nr:unnamed protein product [Phyllotreta striolata]